MTTIFIIHGSYGNPQENWFPWLKQKLENMGHQVISPQFPTPDNQSLQNWLKVLNEEQINEDSILIGHSLGPAFLLNVLERRKAKAAFFVSPFISKLGNEQFDSVNKTFYKKFNWSKLRSNCSKFYIFHSDNDPYVPLIKAEEVASNLNSKIILVRHAGHFNTSAGYDKFELLLEKVISQL